MFSLVETCHVMSLFLLEVSSSMPDKLILAKRFLCNVFKTALFFFFFRLKQLEEEKLKHSFENSPRDDGMRPLKPDLDGSIDEHITRLIEERDTLLRTGVYTTQDRIIAELDRQIRDSMVQKKTNNL